MCSLSGSIYLVRAGHHIYGGHIFLMNLQQYLYWQSIDVDELQFSILDSPVSFKLTQLQIGLA